MFIDIDTNISIDPVLKAILAMIGDQRELQDPVRLEQGIYEIHHFSGNLMLERPSWSEYPELPDANGNYRNAYGACDSLENFLEVFKDIKEDPSRKFMATLTPIIRETQPPQGGWRWHKWGPYIGKHDPQHEYIYDEKDIDKVYVYHIYEKQPEGVKS